MDKLKAIQLAYKEFEEAQHKKGRKRFWETEVGIYGPTYIDIIYRFLMQIHIGNEAKFLDLGSGDGRAVLVASLFCKAEGIEYNKELVEESRTIAKKIGINATFHQGDYLSFNISKFDIIFINPDHGFHKGLDEKLAKEMQSHQVLWVHNSIFLPEKLKKGRTIWIDQMPIIEYRRESGVEMENAKSS